MANYKGRCCFVIAGLSSVTLNSVSRYNIAEENQWIRFITKVLHELKVIRTTKDVAGPKLGTSRTNGS